MSLQRNSVPPRNNKGSNKKRSKSSTRKQRRSATIVYDGKEYEPMKFIKMRASELPPAMDSSTDPPKPVDHEAMLRKFYMQDGVKGINDYLSMIASVTSAALPYVHAYDKKQKQDEQRRTSSGIVGLDGQPISSGRTVPGPEEKEG
jgi:hypothetical protein